jgi:hypothetical protein
VILPHTECLLTTMSDTADAQPLPLPPYLMSGDADRAFEGDFTN